MGFLFDTLDTEPKSTVQFHNLSTILMLSSENVDININLELTILQAFISGVLRRYGLTDQSGLYLTDTAFSTRKSM